MTDKMHVKIKLRIGSVEASADVADVQFPSDVLEIIRTTAEQLMKLNQKPQHDD